MRYKVLLLLSLSLFFTTILLWRRIDALSSKNEPANDFSLSVQLIELYEHLRIDLSVPIIVPKIDP